MLNMMKFKDFNNGVKLLQAALKVNVDGVYGNDTLNAVNEYQSKEGLVVDGIAGYSVIKSLNLNLTPTPLLESDYQHAANELGLTIPEIKAFALTETGEKSFFTNNAPVILFERAVFYRQLKPHVNIDILNKAVEDYPDICNTVWGGYQGGVKEYDRLNTAISISLTSTKTTEYAYESCSWGKFQIMGYNWATLGYATIDSWVRAMNSSEADHLEAFVRFIKHNSTIIEAVKNKDWAKVALHYNGPAQVEAYSQRLEHNYKESL